MNPLFSTMLTLLSLIFVSTANAQFRDYCNGRYEGVWGYKEGRSMSLTVSRQGQTQVLVTVAQANGAETLNGQCTSLSNGTTRLIFSGGANSGNLTVDQSGRISGVVSNYSYNGNFSGGGAPQPPPPPPPQADLCEGYFTGQLENGENVDFEFRRIQGNRYDVREYYRGQVYRGDAYCRMQSYDRAEMRVQLFSNRRQYIELNNFGLRGQFENGPRFRARRF